MSYKITWKPAHADNFASGRNGKVPAWLVHHRMVGFLTGTDRHFAKPGVRTSTHFGIGHRTPGGPVEISQYVRLDDRAFGNGNNVTSSGAEVPSLWNQLNYPSRPNEHTISIEHEDGGTVGRGVVTDDIIEASIWLDELLLSGDPLQIREAGIRFSSDALVKAIARITPRDATHIIDHHFIAGPLKPFCWRKWLDDPGFPQARYLDALTSEDGMLGHTIDRESEDVEITIDGAAAIWLDTGELIPVLKGEVKKALGFGKLDKPYGTGTGDQADRQSGFLLYGPRLAWILAYAAREVPSTGTTQTVTLSVEGAAVFSMEV